MKPTRIALLFAAILAIPSFAAEDAKKDAPLPLKPARKVDFSTDEGTWLSLDVSPDGKTIIFDLLGDLYTIPFAGGEAKKITTGMGFNNQPRYSPDGNFIAYVSDRGGAENVWISKPDGTDAKQLSQDEQVEFATPIWTPDSQYVIASRARQFPIDTFELWMYHVKGGAGSAGHQVQRRSPTRVLADWSPLHRRFSFARRPLPLLHNARRIHREGLQRLVPTLANRRAAIASPAKKTSSPTPRAAPCSPSFRPTASILVYATRYETETGLRIRDMRTAAKSTG